MTETEAASSTSYTPVMRADDKQTALRLLKAHVNRLLGSLNERDADVLRMRYGMGGHEPMTLQEIGEKIKLSRERVRQIEVQAIRKLRRALSAGHWD